MRYLRYVLLALVLWSMIPFSSMLGGQSAGMLISAVTFLFLILYYFLEKKGRILFVFILLGIGYYVISGFNFDHEPRFFINALVRYMLTIVCATELARNTSINEVFIFLGLGAISIVIHAAFFQDNFGRYSGYYLNPNLAGAVCAFGYCMSYGIKNKTLKIIGQFVFIFSGILTFSRYFFLIWIMISLLAVVADRKNSVNLGIGAGVLIVLFSVASLLSLNTSRFSALESFINNDQSSNQTAALEEDSRLDTWSRYYEMILENPLAGNGYLKLSGTQFSQGVHNAYLLTLGEAGIFPFLLLSGIYLYLLFQSLKFFKTYPVFIFLTISIMGFMAVAHNFYDNLIVLFMSLWLFVKMIEDKGVNLQQELIQ